MRSLRGPYAKGLMLDDIRWRSLNFSAISSSFVTVSVIEVHPDLGPIVAFGTKILVIVAFLGPFSKSLFFACSSFETSQSNICFRDDASLQFCSSADVSSICPFLRNALWYAPALPLMSSSYSLFASSQACCLDSLSACWCASLSFC